LGGGASPGEKSRSGVVNVQQADVRLFQERKLSLRHRSRADDDEHITPGRKLRLKTATIHRSQGKQRFRERVPGWPGGTGGPGRTRQAVIQYGALPVSVMPSLPIKKPTLDGRANDSIPGKAVVCKDVSLSAKAV